MKREYGTTSDAPGEDVRSLTLQLIDFLAAYDAQRSVPVRDIAEYGLFRLQREALPVHPAVAVHPSDDRWLTVEFLDLPPAPEVPEGVREFLVNGSAVVAVDEPRIIAMPAEFADHLDGADAVDGDEVDPAGNGSDVEAVAPRVAAREGNELLLGVNPADLDFEKAAVPTDAATAEADRSALALARREQLWQERTEPARVWIEEGWRPWADQWRLVSAVKSLHRSLFEQRERLLADRDSVELVWGFGRLHWTVEGARIEHPLVTVPVEIEVAERSELIYLRPSGAPEVENRFLQGVAIHDRAGHTAVRNSIDADGVDPWFEEDFGALITRIVRAVDDEGVVVETGAARPDHAWADLGWTLFLRRRVPQMQEFLEAMRALYREDEQSIPPPLRAVISRPDTAADGSDLAADPDGPEDGRAAHEPMLLPLATNEEQQRILESVSTGVTVQGPPGTGKSHTIANLISHYVAYGKRVLVVAEKEQALRVLAEKVPSGIRELTVSVLGSDEEGRRKLESSIMQIQTKVSGVDKKHSDSLITRLTAELDSVDRAFASTTTDMLRARRAETVQLAGDWLAGTSPTPQTAATWLAANAHLNYVTDHLVPELSAPLGVAELDEFITLVGAVGAERSDRSGLDLPLLEDLPTAGDLSADLERAAALREAAERARRSAGDISVGDTSAPGEVRRLVEDLEAERHWLGEVGGSWQQRVLGHLRDPLHGREWISFRDEVRSLRETAMTVRAPLRAHQIEVIGIPGPTFAEDLAEAGTRLAESGRLGVFARDAKRAVELCRVDGQVPTTAAQVQLCRDWIRLAEIRQRLMTIWTNQMGAVGAPMLAGLPEEAAALGLTDLDRVLAAVERWQQLSVRLTAFGGPPDTVLATTEGLDGALGWCADLLARQELSSISQAAADLRSELVAGAAGENASPLWSELAEALQHNDTARWAALREQVAELAGIAPAGRRLRELRDRLAAVAPMWTRRVLADVAAAGSPEDLPAAWQWRQLEGWVQGTTALPAPGILQARLEELAEERRRTVTSLVTERAWRQLADNLGATERMALQSYIKAMARYGKTGGKFAQRWINEMREALDESKTAVPVWIMPTARAIASFRPAAVPPFDVLIIDEASQIGFEALPLLSLAKSAIVVGDDKQTSPENVGLNRQQVFDLMDGYLMRVPKYRTLFDPDNSLYDLAIQKFAAPVMLTEHFRSLPEIIAFSNTHAYDNRIVPLRDQPPRPGWTPLGLVRVRDGYRRGDVNEPEAEQVVELIARLCVDPDYDGMTFGVIALVGTAQAKRIWELLYDRLGPEVMEARRIRCGEPANFQGDERDVMVLSTVVAHDPQNPGGRFGAMTGLAQLRRMNVAASRARNQMWVVTSVDPEALPNGDLRAALIRHCEDPGVLATTQENLEQACESDFEKRVLNRLLARGYRSIKVQQVVGRYRLDIVVEGPSGRLAIECDGDRWHGEDVWHADRSRQQVLERAGWTFERIRGSAFYRDPEQAMEPVWAHLDKLGIPTGDEWMATTRRSQVFEVSGDAGADLAGDAGADLAGPDLAEADLAGVEVPGAGGSVGPDGPKTFVEWEEPAPAEPGDVESPDDLDAEFAALVTSMEPAEAWPMIEGGAAAGESATSVDPAEPDRSADPQAEPAVGVEPLLPPFQIAESSGLFAASTKPARSRHAAPPEPEPYRIWERQVLPAVDTAGSGEIIEGLVDIVTSEGPIYARRAFQLYVRATGKEKVGTEIRRILSAVTGRAVRSSALMRLADGAADAAEWVLYLPDQEPVQLRELGPRDLYDVPHSEIQLLVAELGLDWEGGPAEVEAVKRAVLGAFGLKNLTAKASHYLDRTRLYRWEV
ncbi:DUF559 domain-containing protein [Nakamurella silvestris]|nr:DUF559 domain-containing protein [Nakamurella silvestris]